MRLQSATTAFVAKGKGSLAVLTALFALLTTSAPARADRIENDVAVFAALDKVTARISKLEVPLGQTVDFGSLKLTPRICYTRPATEQPNTSSFVEVDEKELEGATKRIFTGWMFAESPGLNAVEHPVFDIWLTGCNKPKGGAEAAIKATPDQPAAEGEQAGQSGEVSDPVITRRRIRR